MPRYRYRCDKCEHNIDVIHSMDETIDFCTNCKESGTMVKQLTRPTYCLKTDRKDEKVGTITKEYIELNKKLLEEEKQKAISESYDPT